MKTIVAIALVSLFVAVAVAEWGAPHPFAARALESSTAMSQIYIHGTPVCVFRQGESIAARVGECGDLAGPGDGHGQAPGPDDGAPGLALPPGHPPVGPDTSPDLPDGAGRRYLI